MNPADAVRTDINRIAKTVRDLKAVNNTTGPHQALAQCLTQFYTGLESSWEKILKLSNQVLPDKSGQYHRKLLTLAIESKLVASQHVDFMDDLMSFRHFAGHAYGTDYRLDEVKNKAEATDLAWPDLQAQLENALPAQ